MEEGGFTKSFTFNEDGTGEEVQAAEDAWNTRDPDRVALAYTEDTEWRNRAEFLDLRLHREFDLNCNRLIEPGEVRRFLDAIRYRDRIFASDYVQATKYADNISRVGEGEVMIPLGVAEDYLGIPRSGL